MRRLEPPSLRVTALTLAKATAAFQKVTTELIGLLVEQSREPNDLRARRIAELEGLRDQAHDHLNQVEAEYARSAGR